MNGGINIEGRVDSPAGEAAGIDHSTDPTPLAGAILGLVRDVEAELAINVNALNQDADALRLGDPDKEAELARLRVEAAYAAGQRDTLERFVDAVAGVVTQTARSEKN